MTTITLPRATVEQVLEALTPWADSDHTVQHAAYHALRAALAQAEPFSPDNIARTQAAWTMGYEARKAEEQAEPEQSQRWEGDHNIESPNNACMHKSYCMSLKAEPVQEPVFEVGFGWLDDATKYPRGTKLYLAPPQRKETNDE